jgi:hypothetical protein
MNEWKLWSKQFERDMRDAFESVRAAVSESDATEIADGATEFAQTIIECAVLPVAAFLAGLPRTIDADAWKSPRRWKTAARDWDDHR